jgi:hypothetical protein
VSSRQDGVHVGPVRGQPKLLCLRQVDCPLIRLRSCQHTVGVSRFGLQDFEHNSDFTPS